MEAAASYGGRRFTWRPPLHMEAAASHGGRWIVILTYSSRRLAAASAFGRRPPLHEPAAASYGGRCIVILTYLSRRLAAASAFGRRPSLQNWPSLHKPAVASKGGRRFIKKANRPIPMTLQASKPGDFKGMILEAGITF